MKKKHFFLIFVAIVFLLLLVSMVFSNYYVRYKHDENIRVMKLFSAVESNLFVSNKTLEKIIRNQDQNYESLEISLIKLEAAFTKLENSIEHLANVGGNKQNPKLVNQLEIVKNTLKEIIKFSELIHNSSLSGDILMRLNEEYDYKFPNAISQINDLKVIYYEISESEQDSLETIQEIRIAITVLLFTTLLIWLFTYIKSVNIVQHKIRESESKYRNLFLNSPLGIFHFDKTGVITDFNDKFVEILGSSREKLTGFNMLSQLPDQKLVEQLRLTLLSGTGYYEDLYTSITSGKEVFVKLRLRGIRNIDDKIVSGMGVVEDISELKKVEKTLRESLDRNSAIVSALPDLLFQLTPDGIFTDYYARIDDELLLNPDQFIGKNINEIFPEDLAAITMEKIQSAMASGELQLFEYPFTIKNEIRYYESRIVKSGSDSILAIIRDISANKRTEQMLQASRERYETFINQTDEGIYRIEFSEPISTKLLVEHQAQLFYKCGYIAECNSAFVKMYGAKYPSELIGKQIEDFHDLDNFPENFSQTVSLMENSYRVENLRTIEKDHLGNIHHFSNNAFGIVENDYLIRMWGTQKDITELVEAEEEKKILYRAVEQSQVSIVITDLNGNIEYVNPKFESVTGYRYEEVIGKNPKFLKSGLSNDEQYKELWSKISKGENWTGIFHNKKKNGELFFESAAISPIVDDDGNVRHYVAVKEDITELTKAQIELKNYKEYLEQVVERRTEELNNKNIFLRTLIDTIPNPVFVKDKNGKYTDVNKAFVDMFGIEFNDIIGKDVRVISRTELAIETEEIDRKLLQEYGKKIYESVVSTNNSKETPIMVYKASFGPEGEMPEGIAGLIIDITESKKTQEQMQKALEQERELNEMKTNFISLASHELRTPLTAIYSSTELIEKFGRKWSEEKYKSHIARIKYSVENLTDLMEDLLTLSRVGTGKIVFNPCSLNLQLVIEENIANLELLKKENHQLDINYSLRNEQYILDEKLIKYIIQNLVSNAIKYSPDGGRIEVTTQDDNENIFIKVKDNGIGIAPEELNNLFEPFFRGRNVSNISGTGLGLSIVREAVELHNGTIDVKSELNKGTQFKITLPIIK